MKDIRNNDERHGHASSGEHEDLSAANSFDEQKGKAGAHRILCADASGEQVAGFAVEVEGAGNDRIGISGNHIDTGDLLCALDEESQKNTTESLSFSTFQQFPVMEWCGALLSLKRGFDTLQILNYVRIIHRLIGQTVKDVVCFLKTSLFDKPTGRLREKEN